MLSIDSKNMKLEVDGEVVTITFEHPLKDSKDAHQTLIAMTKAAKD